MFSQISLLDEMCMGKFTLEHLTTLQTVTKALRDEQFRFNVERGVLERLFAVLVRLYDEFRGLDEGRSVSLRLQLTAECFRAHRNACVQCSHNQCLLRDQGCIQVSLGILGTLLKITTGDPDNLFDAIRCGIQFLGNIAVGNHLCKADIWGHAFPHMFLDLLELCDEKATAYACMVLHTCLDEDKTEQLWTEPQHLKVALKIMELCRTEPDIDWPFLIATQHFFRSSELTKRIYAEMNDQERQRTLAKSNLLQKLELILAQLGEGKEEDCLIPPRTGQILASYFQNSCKSVLSLSSASSANDQKALAVVRLLDILCEMTSKTNFRTLQDHPDLLQSTVELLKEVHLLGKASKNVFSAAQDFSLTEPGGAASHPAVSFTAHLIRLIGNLCHGHMANKDQIRELDGIALILDCCSIDSNNPFISQWAVFAIRNILEHNLENQKLVQGLKRQGVADDSMLREMGFRVEQRDGSLLLRPLKKEEWHGDN